MTKPVRLKDPASTTTGYSFRLSCPECGGPLAHVTAGKPTRYMTQARADCLQCRCQLLVRAELLKVVPGNTKNHPTADEGMSPQERDAARRQRDRERWARQKKAQRTKAAEEAQA